VAPTPEPSRNRILDQEQKLAPVPNTPSNISTKDLPKGGFGGLSYRSRINIRVPSEFTYTGWYVCSALFPDPVTGTHCASLLASIRPRRGLPPQAVGQCAQTKKGSIREDGAHSLQDPELAYGNVQNPVTP
jgi:hypothetical protein